MDVPGVTEPEDGIRVSAVVGEQLALAGANAPAAPTSRPSCAGTRPGTVRVERWESLPSDLRTGWLVRADRPAVLTLMRWSSQVRTASEATPAGGGPPRPPWPTAASRSSSSAPTPPRASSALPVHFELGVLLMTAVRLALSELRRLTAGRLPKLAVVALLLVPVLYGGLYLYANHDPYGASTRSRPRSWSRTRGRRSPPARSWTSDRRWRTNW